MDAADELARQVVAEWFTRLWVSRPSWLTAIPDAEATKDLIDNIAAAIRAGRTIP